MGDTKDLLILSYKGDEDTKLIKEFMHDWLLEHNFEDSNSQVSHFDHLFNLVSGKINHIPQDVLKNNLRIFVNVCMVLTANTYLKEGFYGRRFKSDNIHENPKTINGNLSIEEYMCIWLREHQFAVDDHTFKELCLKMEEIVKKIEINEHRTLLRVVMGSIYEILPEIYSIFRDIPEDKNLLRFRLYKEYDIVKNIYPFLFFQ